MLPQNPQALFVKATVREDLLEILPKSERKPSVLHRSFRSASWQNCSTAIPTIYPAANSSVRRWRKVCS